MYCTIRYDTILNVKNKNFLYIFLYLRRCEIVAHIPLNRSSKGKICDDTRQHGKNTNKFPAFYLCTYGTYVLVTYLTLRPFNYTYIVGVVFVIWRFDLNLALDGLPTALSKLRFATNFIQGLYRYTKAILNGM